MCISTMWLAIIILGSLLVLQLLPAAVANDGLEGSNGSQGLENAPEPLEDGEEPVVFPPQEASSGQAILPPCRNYSNQKWCDGVLRYRGSDYCRQNFFFGRWQCCGTCAHAVHPGLPPDEGVVSKLPRRSLFYRFKRWKSLLREW